MLNPEKISGKTICLIIGYRHNNNNIRLHLLLLLFIIKATQSREQELSTECIIININTAYSV